VYKELLPMKKDQVDFVNKTVWIPDSKTPNGVAELPLTEVALQAFRNQMRLAGPGEYLFPSDLNAEGHQRSLRTVWRLTLKRAGFSYFRLYDLRSTYATRLSAGGVADEWVTGHSKLRVVRHSKLVNAETPFSVRDLLQFFHFSLPRVGSFDNDNPVTLPPRRGGDSSAR
jgi:integrase